ncbi:hypothetical protein H0H81_006068 [Sphagnurus paluster]|uniref:Uncharacterized protein n=1 Tax=Sphagnurus paluster TaxID=117069 RepID=A0A9P7K7I1_9AGAR|nr:hypothetical protein H0H81_006068 [Sphagnurus paluster]
MVRHTTVDKPKRSYHEIPTHHGIPVDEWLRQVSNYYLVDQDAHMRQPLMVVKEIKFYKETSGVQHEFLVAQVAHQNENDFFLIRIERHRKPPCNSTNATDGSSAQNRELLLLSATSSPSSPGSIQAHDSAILNDSWPKLPKLPKFIKGDTALVYTLPFAKGNYPTLLDLIIVAERTHFYRPEYAVLDTQCFWFAIVVFKVLENIYQVSRITHRGDEHVILPVKNGGSVGPVPIQDQDPVQDAQAIQRMVKTKRDEIKAAVGIFSPSIIAPRYLTLALD